MDNGEKRSRSPQEKKALSYAHDRRNAYGENKKTSRKAIPARKSEESRRSRRKSVQGLNTSGQLDEERANVLESSLRHDVERVGGWKKAPDMPLAEFVQRQKGWRVRRENHASALKRRGADQVGLR